MDAELEHSYRYAAVEFQWKKNIKFSSNITIREN